MSDEQLPTKIGESYHDVTVVVDGVSYNLFNSGYGLQLLCTRTSGWTLWDCSNGEKNAVQIGGEYHGNKEFKVLVNGVIVCEARPAEADN